MSKKKKNIRNFFLVFKAHEKNIQGWEGGVKTIQPREGALSLTFALKSNGNDFFKRKGGRKGRVGFFFYLSPFSNQVH